MKAALLCNGPSRILFDLQQKSEYNYIIGCNVPWTEVNATVVIDVGVVRYWWENKLPPVPTWFSESAWRETNYTSRKYFQESFLGLVRSEPEYDSSGHAACRKLIELGYTRIDVYGCDSWFNGSVDSYTHQFLDTSQKDARKQVEFWNRRWKTYMKTADIRFINKIPA